MHVFNPENLKNLTRDEFKSFLLIKNNLHWEGIHRQGNIITADMEALKRFLTYVLAEDIPIEERLSTEFIENGGYWVKGIGRAIITAILLVVYPSKYGVWNTKSESVLKTYGIFPEFQRKEKFGDKYKKVNDVLTELAQDHGISLWQLDGVLGEIAGTSPFYSIDEEEEEQIDDDFRKMGIEDPIVFAMEKHLEDFLITNWEKTIFGKKYALIYNDGRELLSQQYRTEVGNIDILAESKDGKEYLVIELKKGRTTDAVVGQTLRYLTWVKRNMEKGRKVLGVIIVLDADDKLRYSIFDLKDISMYTYRVSFDLKQENFDSWMK